jgi:hypothetical protein
MAICQDYQSGSQFSRKGWGNLRATSFRQIIAWGKIELLAYEKDENYQKTNPKQIPMIEIQNSKQIK